MRLTKLMRRRGVLLAGAAVTALVLAACADDGNENSSGAGDAEPAKQDHHRGLQRVGGRHRRHVSVEGCAGGARVRGDRPVRRRRAALRGHGRG